MISPTAEYALRATVFLGHHAVPCTTAHLAEEINAPPGDLARIIRGLARVGLVESHLGGSMLTRDPSDITILDVLCAVDTFHRIPRCPLGKPAHTSGLCPLHRPLDSVIAETTRSLDQTTIGELIEEQNLLCTLPCVTQPAPRTTRITV